LKKVFGNLLVGFAKWLEKHKENKLVYIVAKVLYETIDKAEKIINYFKREVSLYVNYVHDENGKHPDTVNGFVIRKGAAYSFTGVPWESIDNIIDQLQEEDKPLKFEVSHGSYFNEVYLPRWARKEFALKLIDLQNEHLN